MPNSRVIFQRPRLFRRPTGETASDLSKEERETQKFVDIARKDTQTLASIRTVFPFRFFPTTIYIDRSKLTIDEEYFFGCHEVRTILFKDLMTIGIETGIFFAKLKIEDRLYPTNMAIVPFLRKAEAEKFRTIAEGLRVGINDNIDLTKVPRNILVSQAERIGSVQD